MERKSLFDTSVPSRILREAVARGGEVIFHRDVFKLRFPPGRITPRMHQEYVEYRGALLELLGHFPCRCEEDADHPLSLRDNSSWRATWCSRDACRYLRLDRKTDNAPIPPSYAPHGACEACGCVSGLHWGRCLSCFVESGLAPVSAQVAVGVGA